MDTRKEKIVLITGASSGIGRTTAVRFAKSRYRLALAGRNATTLGETANMCKALGAVVFTIVGDLSSDADAVRTMDETIGRYGSLDVLVNNAGVTDLGGVDKTSLKSYDYVMNTNARAAFHMTMLAVPHLTATKGNIVNVSSFLGTRPAAGVVVYGMSKAAVDQLTKCTALDLAPRHIRVNAVNPGLVDTSLFRDVFDKASKDAFYSSQSNLHPMGRNVQSEEVADAIFFLASDASSYTTGACLPVDGGRACVNPL